MRLKRFLIFQTSKVHLLRSTVQFFNLNSLENLLTQSSRSEEFDSKTDNLIQTNYISFESYEYKLYFDI